MTFAVRSFRPRQGLRRAQSSRASDAHIPRGSVRSEQRRPGRKEPPPEGLRRIWPGASLLVGHSPTGGGCSLLAPRPRPNWAQQTSSNVRPGPLSHAPQLTRPSRYGCKRGPSWAGSLVVRRRPARLGFLRASVSLWLFFPPLRHRGTESFVGRFQRGAEFLLVARMVCWLWFASWCAVKHPFHSDGNPG